MPQNDFPRGWDKDRIARILNQYEPRLNKPAFNAQNRKYMEIPPELVPMVRELIAEYEGRVV